MCRVDWASFRFFRLAWVPPLGGMAATSRRRYVAPEKFAPHYRLLILRMTSPWRRRGGPRGELSAALARFIALLSILGVRCCTMVGRCWWPLQSTPWIGLAVDARAMEVQMYPAKRKKGASLREAVLGLQAAARMSALSIVPAAPCLNFLRWVVPGGCGHPRSV